MWLTLWDLSLQIVIAMTFLEQILEPAFISAISELLWPLVVFVVAIIFRSEIKRLVSRISHAKIFGHEVGFSAKELLASVNTTISESEAARGKGLTDFSPPSAPGEEVKEQPTFHDRERHLGLLDRPIEGAILDSLKLQLIREPASSVLLISAELEKSLRDLLLADGKLLQSDRRSLGRMAEQVEKEYSLSINFASSIKDIIHVRNRLAHGQFHFPDHVLREIGDAALEIVDLVRRIPRDIIYVEKSKLPVYLNDNLAEQLQGYEAVYLLFAAIPGQTGANVLVLTDKLNYYIPGKRVSSKWRPVDAPPNVFAKHPETDLPTLIGHSREVFQGEHIDGMI